MYKEQKFSVSCMPLKIPDNTFVCVVLLNVLIYTFLKFLSEMLRRAQSHFLWQFGRNCFINNLVWQDQYCLLANQLFQPPVLRIQTSNLESYTFKVQVCLRLGFLSFHLQKVGKIVRNMLLQIQSLETFL